MDSMDPYKFAIIMMSICGTTLCVICYFMYKSTIKIAAFKRAKEPWQALALQEEPGKAGDKNESEQPTSEDFDTLPSDTENIDNLRKFL